MADELMRSKRPRLVRVDVRPYGKRDAVVLTPTGRALRVALQPATVSGLLRSCDGQGTIEDITPAGMDPGLVGSLLDRLAREGCLTYGAARANERDWARLDASATESGRPAATRIVLLGDPSLVRLVVDHRMVGRFGCVDTTSMEALAGDADRFDARDTVVVALRERFDPAFLLALDDSCRTRGIRWTQAHLDRERAWVGPLVEPGASPDYRDLFGRRLAAARDPELLGSLGAPGILGDPYLPPEPELVWVLSYLFVDLERWVAGAEAQASWHEVEIDPRQLRVTRHPVLPLPDRPPARADRRVTARIGPQWMVDERTGLITRVWRIEHQAAIPPTLATVHATIGDVRRLYPWRPDRAAGGSVFGDPDEARRAAIGESVERYCGNVVQESLLTEASYHDLVARGEHAVDPERLVLFSDRQYAEPGFPFVRFTRDLNVHWIRGRSLTAERPAWLPASLVYSNWYTAGFERNPPTNNPFYPGLAAGPSLEFAIAAGIQEVIERHATMVWWTNRQALAAVAVPDRLRMLWETSSVGDRQRTWLIHLDNEFHVPVMAGAVENLDECLLTIGFAARPDPEAAAAKAVTEALTLQDVCRDLLDPSAVYWSRVARGEVNTMFIKPWRSDRRYLDDYRADFRDVGDLLCQLQVFLDPRARGHVRSWVDAPERRRLADLPRLEEFSVAVYRRPVEALGHEIFYADITTPDVALTGMSAVRVLVPGLVPNFAAGFPFHGGGRVQRAAVALGWRREALPEHELNLFPMPHA